RELVPAEAPLVARATPPVALGPRPTVPPRVRAGKSGHEHGLERGMALAGVVPARGFDQLLGRRLRRDQLGQLSKEPRHLLRRVLPRPLPRDIAALAIR